MVNYRGKTDIKKNRRGFITVEAAIFLPIFLIGVLTLVYLIKILSLEENTFFVLEQEAKQLSKNAYGVSEEIRPAQGEFFELKVKGKLFHQVPFDIKNVSFAGSKYFYNYQGMDGIILAQLHYDAPLRLPVQLYKNLHKNETLLFRGFIGADEVYGAMEFAEMEKERPLEPVWVFPRSGERFHQENCAYISNRPRKLHMSGDIRKRYDSCKLCKSEELLEGNIIYCFIKTGQVYHRGICKTVEKYVVEMDKGEAIERGYTPCKKCGGG